MFQLYLITSYLNFFITNRSVLLPVFKVKGERKVINLFKKNFKNKKIVPIDCKELIWGFGAIHCMTQQEPKLQSMQLSKFLEVI